ncbi:MAG TPA: diguanylate cyclase [Fibrobacteraceae bacterium]|nr:diguanylate cyclase [Fibrobacteraceae bacterium]
MNVVIIEDRPARLAPLIRRIEISLGHDCRVFATVEQAQNFLSTPDSQVVAVIENQKFCQEKFYHFGEIPIIIVSDGLPVESSLLLRAENVLDYIMDYGVHNYGHIISLLRRAQFHSQIRLLVVDNEPSVRNLFCNLLKKHGFQMLQAKNGREALEILAEHPEVRLVLTDMEMPGMDGATLIPIIRERHNKQELPVIGLANPNDDSEAVQFLRLGANDVLTKPPMALHEVLVRVTQNLALAEAFEEIVELGRKDFLTGLFNRRYFYDTAEKIFAQSRRGRINVAVAMMDIDDFKRVNDSYGHGAGDMAIADVARILKGSLRETDVIARFGGEEFCVLFAGLETSRDAISVSERLIAKIASHRMRYDGHEFSVTLSCGVAIRHRDTLESIIQESDRMLYRAKEQGKNRVIADSAN